jgi:hypothetical protein
MVVELGNFGVPEKAVEGAHVLLFLGIGENV